MWVDMGVIVFLIILAIGCILLMVAAYVVIGAQEDRIDLLAGENERMRRENVR